MALFSYGQAPDTVAGIPVNYDEARVGTYILPDPLTFTRGEKVTDARTWMQERRPEILAMIEAYQFGKIPANTLKPVFEVFDPGSTAFNGKARRKQVRIYFSEASEDQFMDVLIYLPAAADGPAPLMLMINFTANSSYVADPGIRRGTVWNREHEKVEAPDESPFGQFDIVPFIDQGVGLAMVYYGDIQPDFDGGAKFGVMGLLKKEPNAARKPDEAGAIAAWAWGLSRIMDYLQTDDEVDGERVALFGVSRLGKTVLWAGARDERFSLVIPNCSGEGGAALSRRLYGETIAHITHPTRYDYQFAPNYQQMGEDPASNPFDAHMLIALVAPRPVLLQTGSEDNWSDAKGEYLAARAAGPVYELLGKEGLPAIEMPDPGHALLEGDIGFSIHVGGHGPRPPDYAWILEFLERHW